VCINDCFILTVCQDFIAIKFKNFSIEFGTLTWENGKIDVAPETLYEIATGEKISFNHEKTYKVM